MQNHHNNRSIRQTSQVRSNLYLFAAVIGGVIALGVVGVPRADAQQSSGSSNPIQNLMNNLTPDQMQKAQQLLQGQGGQTQGGQSQQSQQPTILTPMQPPNNANLPQSRLEKIMSARAGYNLQQFGYDQVGPGTSVTVPQAGGVQDNYVLGSGDEIDVVLRGQENSEFSTTVDRNGQVVLPKINPISAAGRTLGDFRRDLQAAIHRAYVSTEASVAIGQVRQVSVTVTGEVANPGVRVLTGLSTPLDAILLSSGIKKTGSLRSIRILRGGEEIPLDLYSVLTGHGRANDTLLANGDRIVVLPLGPTVAVAGWVRRPGIYELGGRRSSISVRDVLSMAGGLEVRGKYRLSVLRVLPDGRSQMVTLDSQSGTVGDSDIIFAQPAANQTTSMATLSGDTALAGQYTTKNTKLSDLLKSPGALVNSYTLFGIISRRDPATYLRTLIAFTPAAVLSGAENMGIQSDDIVRVISAQEAQTLFATVTYYQQLSKATDDALRNPAQAYSSLAQSGSGIGGAAQSGAQGASGGSGGAALQALTSSSGQVTSNMSTLQSGNQVTAPVGAPYQQQSGQSQQPYMSGTTPNYPQQPGGTTPNSYYPQQPGGTTPNNFYPQQPGGTAPNSFYPQQPGTAGTQPNGSSAANFEEGVAQPGQVPTNMQISDVGQLASQLLVDPLVLANFLKDHSLNVDGAVHGPGLYLVGPDVTLQLVLAAAGGVTRWADKSAIEVIATVVDSNTGASQTQRKTVSLADAAGADLIISPQDVVRVSKVFTDVDVGSVTVQGELRHNGTYQIVRGEHLSDLLMRAGGLTNNAYPFGTVFLRLSAAQNEKDAFQREAKEIEDQLLMAMSRRSSSTSLSPDAFLALQGYINQLKNQPALGRVSVVADPAVLAASPAMDPLLEPGDVIYIPPRPYAVSVLGEVLQPGSVPFRPNLSASDYINQAGGYSQLADSSSTILVLPDGSARPVESSWLDFGGHDVPPGSTIYVARDLSGLDTHQIIVDTAQIFGQLATAAATLVVISKY